MSLDIRLSPPYLNSALLSSSCGVAGCRVLRNLLSSAVNATSFSLSLIVEDAISASDVSSTFRRGCHRGFPATFKICSLVISDKPSGRSSKRFCITERTRRDVSFLTSSGSWLILLRLRSNISRRGNLMTCIHCQRLSEHRRKEARPDILLLEIRENCLI